MTKDRRVTALLAEARIEPDAFVSDIEPREFPETVNQALATAKVGDKLAFVTSYSIGIWPGPMATSFLTPAHLWQSLSDGMCSIAAFHPIRSYSDDEQKRWALLVVIEKSESCYAAPLRALPHPAPRGIIGRVLHWLKHGQGPGHRVLVGRY